MQELTQEQKQEYISKINTGSKAKRFLESEEWKKLIKPIIESQIKGLNSVEDIALSSEEKMRIEIRARKLAIDYLLSIERLLTGYVIDGEYNKRMLEKRKGIKPISLTRK